uniref:Uncharacterized protein n=1 Tax=Bursaphelenchus xylophilus TaxID=6326 RepID=A0A1I7S8X4_BURXY
MFSILIIMRSQVTLKSAEIKAKWRQAEAGPPGDGDANTHFPGQTLGTQLSRASGGRKHLFLVIGNRDQASAFVFLSVAPRACRFSPTKRREWGLQKWLIQCPGRPRVSRQNEIFPF